MARFLFASHPMTGHVHPALPIVSRLVARGHEVVWYCGVKYQAKIEATGARFAPYREAYDYDGEYLDQAFAGRAEHAALAQIRFDFVHLFAKQLAPQHRDLTAILREFPADVIVADPYVAAAQTINEIERLPFATYNVTCLGLISRDTGPFGLGVLPDASFLGRLRNRVLYALASKVIFKQAADEINRQRRELGLPAAAFNGMFASPYLVLQATVAAFEYPRSDLPPHVHFIGALLSDAPPTFTPPSWWPEVLEKQRPVVLVTQGTTAIHVRDLVAPALMGLAHEDVLVIATGVSSPDTLELDRIPDNARIAGFVPFKPLLPYIDAYVTNAGFGGVHYALANGIPIVAAGVTEDKPEVANRIAYSGAGINLKTSRPTAAQVRAAVLRVLSKASYRQRAQQIQADLARHDAPCEAVTLLERLVATGKPVLRNQIEQPERTPAVKSAVLR